MGDVEDSGIDCMLGPHVFGLNGFHSLTTASKVCVGTGKPAVCDDGKGSSTY